MGCLTTGGHRRLLSRAMPKGAFEVACPTPQRKCADRVRLDWRVTEELIVCLADRLRSSKLCAAKLTVYQICHSEFAQTRKAPLTYC